MPRGPSRHPLGANYQEIVHPGRNRLSSASFLSGRSQRGSRFPPHRPSILDPAPMMVRSPVELDTAGAILMR